MQNETGPVANSNGLPPPKSKNHDMHCFIMDQFLTEGGRAQQIAVFLDANGNVLG
ncbi:hypothetical protein ACFQ3W_14065 [Paenibacillus puldeungensis]|uniref:Uncharacterized protein n=1 Tax=Paenibacillus puldeungensis TaxID=696536 RepID=A0ABW3RZG9_9BACL